MKEHPVLGMLILVIVLWAGVMLMERYTSTQGEMPSLSLYAYYFLCMQEGSAEGASQVCRRELVDGAQSVPLPDLVRKLRPQTENRDISSETPSSPRLRPSTIAPTTTLTTTLTPQE